MMFFKSMKLSICHKNMSQNSPDLKPTFENVGRYIKLYSCKVS